MTAGCIRSSYCQYKTDTGYCGYTGNGCAFDQFTTIPIPKGATYTIVKQVDLTEESINKIADAVVERLWETGGIITASTIIEAEEGEEE